MNDTMNDHLSENFIGKYFLNPDAIARNEKKRMEAHLGKCSLCAELFENTEKFYKLLNAETQCPPAEKDKEIAEKLTSRKRLFLAGRSRELNRTTESIIEGFAEIIEPYQWSIHHRIWRQIRSHPVSTVISGIALAAAFAMLFFFVRPMRDTNIQYVRAKDEFLVAYNKEGGELWRKHIGLGYDIAQLQSAPFAAPLDQYLSACDVDGDGNNEVLAIFGLAADLPRANCIVCYNRDGSERWIYEIHRDMIFGRDSVPDHYTFRRFVIGNSGNNRAAEIYAIAGQATYYQTIIIRLNASDGSLISDFWHSGCISRMMIADIDEDGVRELILGAENNGYNLASVLILDPRNMEGCAPAPAEYTPQNTPPGTEKYYILFPRCDLENFAAHKRNVCTSVQVVPPDSSLLLFVSECVGTTYYPILYHFDRFMNCGLVEGEDSFVTFHLQLEKEGKLTQKLDASYYADLGKNVQYWNGGKFVNSSISNSYYNLPTTRR
jgi:hypothetical protein